MEDSLVRLVLALVIMVFGLTVMIRPLIPTKVRKAFAKNAKKGFKNLFKALGRGLRRVVGGTFTMIGQGITYLGRRITGRRRRQRRPNP
jgi:uncharacterized protein YjeT (DUF2065 family)